jgi:glycosyltransferase involved in cell wall biosynthesis
MDMRGVVNTLYMLRQQAKWHFEKSRVVYLRPDGPIRGHVLLSYMIEPFLRSRQEMRHDHTNYWECVQMAATFLGLGYAVDVINSYNKTFLPAKDYAVFVEHRTVLERVAQSLNQDCLKIMHIDTAHALFQNAAEARRLLDLQRRRGITLRPRRFMIPNLAIEYADCATILGNEFTMSTFAYANKPLYRVPISAALMYDWPEDKDFEACRRHFIWFNSGGLVHKGLDLVLEAFAGLPDHRLTVCGPVDTEEDFAQAFRRELYETPNIRTIGWIDIASQAFRDLTCSAVGLVSPSCSEGGGGSVVTCMHAGLVPIISYESSVDVTADRGVVLRSCSVEEIRRAIQSISNSPIAQIQTMARNAWEYARATHTRKKFAEAYDAAVSAIMRSRSGSRPDWPLP